VVLLRTGVVVGKGGAFTPLLPLTKAGLGARFGTGGQVWPWIGLHDEAAAIVHLLTSTLSGPVNLVGPTPASSDHITKYLAKRLGRPYFLKVPEFAMRLPLGEAAQDLLLSSQDVSAELLTEDGFTFRDTTVESAIDAVF
jgi:NAD dependent epimerase/dehydratase family enzyme